MGDRQPYSQYLDRQSNPIAVQGGVYAGADYDVGAKIAIQMQNREIGPSAYSGSENEQVWDIAPDDLLFTVPGLHSTTNNIKMSVVPCLNGLGATATAQYGAEPDGLMMIKEAVKNQIVFVGAPFQALSSQRGDVERGITVQMGGSKTLRMGNNQFGDDRSVENSIRPGDILAADVPVPGREGLMPGPGMRPKAGVPMNKYTLQLRRHSPHSAGRSLRLHIRNILRDPQKWKLAMGEHLAGTKAWASAAHAVMSSYALAGVFTVRQLIADGVLQLTDEGKGLISAVPLNAPVRTSEQTANEFAVFLAQLYKVIPSTGALNQLGLLNRLPPNGFTKAVKLSHANTLNRIFFDGTNKAFEFGFERNGNSVESKARFQYTGLVDDSKPEGRLLLAQLNHFPAAVSGMHLAIQKDMAFIVGKAMTGGSSFGSGNVHVFLRPL